MKTPLELFRSGLDTMEIAKRLGTSEPDASRRVFLERCESLGLPARRTYRRLRREHIRKFSRKRPC